MRKRGKVFWLAILTPIHIVASVVALVNVLADDRPTEKVDLSNPDPARRAYIERTIAAAKGENAKVAGTQPATMPATREAEPAWLPEGMERDTPLAAHGLGRVEKNGATLEADAGVRVFLLADTKAGIYRGWNPQPRLTMFKLTAPGGISVKADGKVGLLRVTITPALNKIQVDVAFKPEQENEDGVASTLFISGCETQPLIELNGKKTGGGTMIKNGAKVFDVALR